MTFGVQLVITIALWNIFRHGGSCCAARVAYIFFLTIDWRDYGPLIIKKALLCQYIRKLVMIKVGHYINHKKHKAFVVFS